METYAAAIRTNLAERGPSPYDRSGFIKQVEDGGRLAESASRHYHLSDDAIADRVAQARAHLHASLASLADAAENRALIPRTASTIAAVDKTRRLVFAALAQVDYLQPRTQLLRRASQTKVVMPTKLHAALPEHAVYEAVAPSLHMAIKALSIYPRKSSTAPDLVKLALDVHKNIFPTAAHPGQPCSANIVALDDYCTHVDSAITNLSAARRYTNTNADFIKMVELEQRLVRLWRSARVRTIFDAHVLPQSGNNDVLAEIKDLRQRISHTQLNEFRSRMKQYYEFTESSTFVNLLQTFKANRTQWMNEFMRCYEADFAPPFKLIPRDARTLTTDQSIATVSPLLQETRNSLQTAIDQFLHLDISKIPSTAVAHNSRDVLHAALTEVERLQRNYNTRSLDELEAAELNDLQAGWLHSSVVADIGRNIRSGQSDMAIARSSSLESEDSAATAFGSPNSGIVESVMSWIPGTAANTRSKTSSSNQSDLSIGRSSSAGSDTTADSRRDHSSRLSQGLDQTRFDGKQNSLFKSLCNLQEKEFGSSTDEINVELMTTLIGHLACSPSFVINVMPETFLVPFRRALDMAEKRAVPADKRALMLEYILVTAQRIRAYDATPHEAEFRKVAKIYHTLRSDAQLPDATKRHLTLVASRLLAYVRPAAFQGDDFERLTADVLQEIHEGVQSGELREPAQAPLTRMPRPISRYTDHSFLQGGGQTSLAERIALSHGSADEVFAQQRMLLERRLAQSS